MRTIRTGARQGTLLVVAVTMLLATGCSLPAAPWSTQSTQSTPRQLAPAATPVSPLASHTIYWRQNSWFLALRASDGYLRWHVGGCYGCPDDSDLQTPTLAGGALFALMSKEQGNNTVTALTASAATTLWQTPVSGCRVYPEAPLLVADDVVYVALSGGSQDCGPSGWVYALRASDGEVVWRAPFSDRHVWPTVALTDGVLIVATSNDYAFAPEIWLTGLRVSDGKRLWRVARAADEVHVAAADGMVIATKNAGIRVDSGMSVESFRARDGARLWESTLKDSQPRYFAPLLADDMVFVPDGSGYLSALRASDGRVVWRIQTGVRFAATPTFANGRLYMGAGTALEALDPANGATIRSYTIPGLPAAAYAWSANWSAPVVTDTAVFVSVGVFNCNAGPLCNPALLNGKLYALDTATGKLLWQYQTPDGYEVNSPVLG